MADFTASTGFRDLLADKADGLFYFVTLHDDTGGFVAGDTYSAGVRGELATANGYTQGGVSLALTHTGGTGGVLDGPDATWTASGGDIGPASYAACWVAETDSITGAKLLWVDDSAGDPQTTTDGNTMTVAVADTITIPTPA